MDTWALAAWSLVAPAALAWATRHGTGAASFARAQAGLALILAIGIALAWGRVPAPGAPGWTTPPLALALTALFVLGLGPWLMALPGRLGLTGFEPGTDRLAGVPLPLVVLAVVLGGVAEEVLYRAIGFEAVLLATGSGAVAGVLVVGVFALAHAPLWGWGAALTMLVSGGVLTLAYAVTGDLWANILAHVATDLAGLVLPRVARRR